MPGVLLVMTHENAPKQAPFQAKADDRHARPKPQLASDKVEYFGQPVALVVAETAEAARAAASAIVVTYEKAEGAFVLESASGAAYNPGKGPTGAPADSKLGDFDKAFAAASVKIDAIYKTPYQAHAMMEPHASLASWQDGKLTVTSALQLVESAYKSIADTLKLEPRQGRGDLRICRRRLRRQAAGLWRRHPRGAWRRASSTVRCAWR